MNPASTLDTTGKPLDLHEEENAPGGLRYRLDGKPVNPGDVIEVCVTHLGARRWLVGKFHWSHRRDILPVITTHEGVGSLKPGMKFRWPVAAD